MNKGARSVNIKKNIQIHRDCSEWEKTFSNKQLKVKEIKNQFHNFFQKPSKETLKSFGLPEYIPFPTSQLKNGNSFLSYKYYSKTQDYNRNKKKLAISVQDKYKVISCDFRRRLHINSSPDVVKTVLDFDKDFYNCISGRPLKNHCMQYKSIKIQLNKHLRLRQQIGYLEDCNLNIDINHKTEIGTYEKSLRKLTSQVKYFDQFISEDYHKSMVLLEKGEKLISEVNKMKLQLEYLAVEKFTITSKLIGLDFKYGIQQKYGRFLYYLSPPLWRAKNRDFARSVEIEAKGFDLGISSDEDAFAVVYDKMRKECCNEFIKPALYFKVPKNLIDVFKTIEKQQLHNFLHVLHVSPYTKMLNENIKSLKNIINEESVIISSAIEDIKNLLELTERRYIFLRKNFFQILHGLFYESVGSLDVLKNLLHLEFCYEKVYGEKPVNKNIKTVAHALEMFYMNYSQQLDALHNGRVRGAIKVCLESERRKAKNAIVAAKELRLFYRLEKQLLRAHGLPYDGPLLLPVQKITKKKSGKKRVTLEANKTELLMEDQKEHSIFFSDFNELLNGHE